MADAWYEQRTWSAGAREAFLERLKRARGQRRQYLKRQAQVLLEAGCAEGALELLDMGVAENPQHNDNQVLQTLRARALDSLNRTPDALLALRAALAFRRRDPGLDANASLAFAWLVARHRMVALYPEAVGFMAEFIPCVTVPEQGYRFHGAQALFDAERGRLAEAAEHARQALAAAAAVHSGWSRHPGLGLVADPDPLVHPALETLAMRRSGSEDS